jgi:hypothetical protein
LGAPCREEEEERGGGPVGTKRVAREEGGPGRGTDPGEADAGGAPCGNKGGRGPMTCGPEATVPGRWRVDLVQIQMNSNKVQILSTLAALKSTFLSSKNLK